MAGLKIVEAFDHTFSLEEDAKKTLYELLKGESFCRALCRNQGYEDVEFTHILFQPAPYTVNETKGMPREYEHYYESAEYIIVNVPPQFMFEAKIFKPSRLCAIYRIVPRAADN